MARMLGKAGRNNKYSHECYDHRKFQYGSRHGCGCGWPRTTRQNRKIEQRTFEKEVMACVRWRVGI